METNQQHLLERITTNAQIFGGKPIIRGLRFRVNDVLDMLASGMSPQEVLDDFPYLEAADITASLMYASILVRNDLTKMS